MTRLLSLSLLICFAYFACTSCDKVYAISDQYRWIDIVDDPVTTTSWTDHVRLTTETLASLTGNLDIVVVTTGTLRLEVDTATTLSLTPTSVDLEIGTDPGDDFTINTTGFVYEGDNNRVGIGTASPSRMFHTYRDTTDTAVDQGRFEQDGTGDAYITFSLTGLQAFALGLDNSDGDKFKIADQNNLHTNTRLTIDASGNVGIGATAPAADFEVNTSAQDVSALIQSDSTYDTSLEVDSSGANGDSTLTLDSAAGNAKLIIDGSGAAQQYIQFQQGGSDIFRVGAETDNFYIWEGTATTRVRYNGTDDRWNFDGGELLKLPVEAAAPSGAVNGDMYYDSTTSKFRGYAGGAWTDLH